MHCSIRRSFPFFPTRRSAYLGSVFFFVANGLLAAAASAAPKVIVLSLDGATPRFVDQYLGPLNPSQGLGLLQSKGVRAQQNVTITPSLTAAAHIAIATGSTAAANDITANSFHLVASPFALNISGFSAPIGGYQFDGLVPSPAPTAQPIWLALRAAGKSVVAATFPGADGLDVRVPGVGALVQPAGVRTVNYTVPFGAFGGIGAQGFELTAGQFEPAPGTTVDQLTAAGVAFFGPVLQKTTSLETFTVGGVAFAIQVAALDTTDDNQTNYDTLVFFDATQGIRPGPFPLPSTGPAYVRASDARSSLFYLEGSANRAGVSFYVSNLAPDLANVRITRYSANFIPRNPAVLADVDDINNNVGFWAPQPDFRIPERLSPGFTNFPDPELEAVYQDQVRTFTDYQVRVALRAIRQNPDADLVLLYLEQPDGSGHQFLLTDPRQASDFTNPNTIGANQDPAKIARYQAYLRTAYQVADQALQRIIDAVGIDAATGKPNSNLFVVSDHGFDPFHTAVNMNALLAGNNIDLTKVRAVTSGPAVNVYINLQGREPDGTVTREEYVALQQQVIDILRGFVDANPNYTEGAPTVPVFDKVYQRPSDLNDPNFGRSTSAFIGQDGGDVFALLQTGYNFDGTQSPVVRRLGDPATGTPVLSVPNFYGAHGYDPTLPNLSAIFFAAGPDIEPATFSRVRNIDIAPTIARLLGVAPAPTVQGQALNLVPTPLQLQSVVSRKDHGAAGTFDLPLALDGSVGIESRRAGPGNTHTLVFTFNNNVTQADVEVTSGTGSVVGTPTFAGNDVIVELAGVADVQTVTVRLSNVADVWGPTPATFSVNLGLLLGDVNGDRSVNAQDVDQVKADASSALANANNFRSDVVVSGSINASDVAQTRARSGQALP